MYGIEDAICDHQESIWYLSNLPIKIKEMRQLILILVLFLNILSSIDSQKKPKQDEFFSKTEIVYIYNRLLDEILHNDFLVFIEFSEIYKVNDPKDIILEMDLNTDNNIFTCINETENLSAFKKIPMQSKIKRLPFINLMKIKKKNIQDITEIFEDGIKFIRFTDIIYKTSGEFFVGAATLDMIPGVKEKDVNLGGTYILKGYKCTSGQIILSKILMQNKAAVDLSSIKCN